MPEIDKLKQYRRYLLSLINGLSNEQLLRIPEGFNNNILWNLGHLVSTQQILHYRRSGLPTPVDESFTAPFRKGTSPKDWATGPDVEKVRELFVQMPLRLEKDYRESVFTNFEPYTTSTGVVLTNIGDSISFNNYHEGVHTGVILSLRKYV